MVVLVTKKRAQFRLRGLYPRPERRSFTPLLVKPDAKYDESPVVATLSFVISTRLKMSPTLPSSCEGIMPHIICFGEVTFNFNIDGTTLLLLMVLLVALGTVLLKILKLLKSFFH